MNPNIPPRQPDLSSIQLDLSPPTQKRRRIPKIVIALLAVAVSMLLAIIAAVGWYALASRPVARESHQVRVEIAKGSGLAAIGQTLEENNVIKSSTAFEVYVRLHRASAGIQAGAYTFDPSQSLSQIVSHMRGGASDDQVTITFIPGATIWQNRQVLIDAGYSESAVDAALEAEYDHPLLTSKPATADLEGYIYGESYTFAVSATPEDILRRTFDEYYAALQRTGTLERLNAGSLSLYQTITLASIIQREVPSVGDQRQVAQVFFSRLSEGMRLDSDVTYQYIADKTGQVRSLSIDSPYNTRRYTGLPPGPIATPGISALEAVSNPAPGNFLYFVSGDDEINYFARTYEEHQRNVAEHCIIKCSFE